MPRPTRRSTSKGVDAAHKLAILAALAFGAKIDFAAVDTGGIGRVRAADIAQAEALGYRIRLIGMADAPMATGTCSSASSRASCPSGHPLAAVDGPTNAVVAEGNFVGRLLFQGAGAGDGPTASAVAADIIDIARCCATAATAARRSRCRRPSWWPLAPADAGHRTSRTYLRFMVADRPGVLAEIAAAMRDGGVSIESLIQQGRPEEGGEVLVAIVTHEGPEANVAKALALLEGSASLAEAPLVMRLLG